MPTNRNPRPKRSKFIPRPGILISFEFGPLDGKTQSWPAPTTRNPLPHQIIKQEWVATSEWDFWNVNRYIYILESGTNYRFAGSESKLIKTKGVFPIPIEHK
jgi:hypothetical protein